MKGSGDYMKQSLVVRKDMLEQVYDCIDLAIRNIYDEYPHEVQTILIVNASVILWGEACKEYCLINKDVLEKG